jgi:hypothetical protein
MFAQLARYFEEELKLLGRVLVEGGRLLAIGARTVWSVLRMPLAFLLNLLLALLLLFEEWGWRPLSNLLAQLARFRPWALLEQWVAGLPPYGALVALAVPSAVIIPAKILGVYFLATGHFLTAAVVIICAKIVGTGLVARIFLLTKPQLMQIGWVRTAYEKFVPWQEALFARVRASWIWRYASLMRSRANGYVRRSWSTLRPQLEALWSSAPPKVPERTPARREGPRRDAPRPPPGPVI